MDQKILFVDMESPLGHKDVNYFFLKYIFPKLNANIYYLIDRKVFELMQLDYNATTECSIHFFPDQNINTSTYLKQKLENWMKIQHIKNFVYRNNINTVFFMTYDTLSLVFTKSFFLKKKTFLFNHDNIARFIKSPARRFLFKTLHPFVHLLYHYPGNEQVITRIKEVFNFENVYSVPHHINKVGFIKVKEYNREKIVLYAPSNSNDHGKILEVVSLIRDSGIQLFAKVPNLVYDKVPPGLRKMFFTGFISQHEFELHMQQSDFVLLFYYDDYRFRTSGLLFDAIAFEKPVITDNKFFYDTYILHYGIGRYVPGIKDIISEIANITAEEYEGMIQNIKILKEKYDPDIIGENIVKIMRKQI